MTKVLEFPQPMLHDAESYLSLPWSWHDEWSPEDGCFIVTVRELPDFFAAGSDRPEAYRNAREALISHLQGYLATGTPIPVPEPTLRTPLVRFA